MSQFTLNPGLLDGGADRPGGHPLLCQSCSSCLGMAVWVLGRHQLTKISFLGQSLVRRLGVPYMRNFTGALTCGAACACLAVSTQPLLFGQIAEWLDCW
jgi:hypothetical protein